MQRLSGVRRLRPLMTRVAVLLFVGTLAGCGGADFGAELSARPRPVTLKTDAGSVTRLPQDQKFTITLAPSSKEPGLTGAAEADSHATADGAADAAARVSNGGKASASFQLGHAFKNESERQIDADIRIRFKYEIAAQATPPADVPGATVGVRLYARNARNVLVRTVDLLSHTTENGAASRRGDNDLTCTLTLGPGEALNVFLAGLAGVEAREDRTASASVKLSDVQMEITSKPAPPVRTPGDGQP